MGSALFLSTIILCLIASNDFLRMHETDAIYPSSGLSEKKSLSDYFKDLKNTPGDTDIFIYKGTEDGGHVLILGGTHPNEPAGFMTAALIAERIGVDTGKVIIVPQANRSAFSHNDPHEGSPQKYPIEIPGGKRWFRYGSRLTNPVHQWPDPAMYINPAGQKLSGTEGRNLNRCYPGRKNGNLTEKIAYGIMELIHDEKIDLAMDLHEAAPEYPVINAIVFHENSSEVAALAYMELQLQGFEFRLEASPPNLRGLSHREWGDHGQVMAVLLETANASHGRLKGKPSAALVVEGRDKNYVKASSLGRLFVPFDEEGIPLRQRVARHISSVKALLEALREINPDKAVKVNNLPTAMQLKERGIGFYLSPQK